MCNSETHSCSEVSLNSVKVKAVLSKCHINENLETVLGSITASFNCKLDLSVPFVKWKTLFVISYAVRSANARSGIFHPAQ